MKEIKKYLKRIGITQKNFADRIGLSRPTLDLYIDMFENGDPIPRERYDIIFNRLFGVGELSAKDFEINLQQVEILLERDQKYGINDLSPEAADYISLVIKTMTRDLKKINWNKDIYSFINILISSYRENDFFQYLVEYFIFLNGYKDIESITIEQKPYFANMYKTFRKLIDEPQKYIEKDYDEFIHRCIEIREDKKRKNNLQKNKLKEHIQQMITEYERKGVDLTDEEILEAIKKKIVKEKIKEINL